MTGAPGAERDVVAAQRGRREVTFVAEAGARVEPRGGVQGRQSLAPLSRQNTMASCVAQDWQADSGMAGGEDDDEPTKWRLS